MVQVSIPVHCVVAKSTVSLVGKKRRASPEISNDKRKKPSIVLPASTPRPPSVIITNIGSDRDILAVNDVAPINTLADTQDSEPEEDELDPSEDMDYHMVSANNNLHNCITNGIITME